MVTSKWPLNVDEKAARRKARNDKEDRDKKTSMSRSESANRRWHPEWFEEEEEEEVDMETNSGDDGVGISSSARMGMVDAAVEIEGGGHGNGDLGGEEHNVENEVMSDVEGRLDEVEVGEGVQVSVRSEADLEEENANEGTCQGSSERSKLRARECLNTHLSKKNGLGQIDVLWKLGLMLIAGGQELVGVNLNKKTTSHASNLTKRQIFYAADQILKESKNKKSLAFWLPNLIKESLSKIKKELGL